MIKLFLLFTGILFLSACAKEGSVYYDPSWNKPPSERYQSPSGDTTKDAKYDDSYRDLSNQNKKSDPYFEEFLKKQNKKAKK